MFVKEIRRLFTRHKERYGSPRLHRLLTTAGWVVSRTTLPGVPPLVVGVVELK